MADDPVASTGVDEDGVMEITAGQAQLPDEGSRFPSALYDALATAAEAAHDAERQKRAFERRRALYRIERVPADRFAFAELTHLIEARRHEGGSVLAPFLPEAYEIEEALTRLGSRKGNTTYEEVQGIGFGPDQETVAAVLTVKRTTGYAAGLCSTGSREHIAFWLELQGTWHYLGTSSLRVHDSDLTPAEAEQYLVIRPVAGELLPAKGRAVLGTLRVVLSWNTPPSTTDPHAIPYWGNREETRVSVRPRKGGSPGQPWEGGSIPRVFRVDAARAPAL
jgi:hypothetical protein